MSVACEDIGMPERCRDALFRSIDLDARTTRSAYKAVVTTIHRLQSSFS